MNIPQIFCFLCVAITTHGFLLKYQFHGGHSRPPCCPFDVALGLNSPQDDEKEIRRPHPHPGHEVKSIKWNIPNLLRAHSDMSGLVSPNYYLNEIYRAGLKAQAQQLQPIQSTPSTLYSDNEKGPSRNSKGNNSDNTIATISLPNNELERVRRFLDIHLEDNDLGHNGRFGSGNSFVSLQANLVFSMDKPLTYIHDVLSSSENDNGQTTSPEAGMPFQIKNKRSSSSNQVEEVVVFCPGLHTPLSQSTRQREYLSQVLNGMNISLLHLGTHTRTSSLQTTSEEFDSKIQVYLTKDTIFALKALDMVLDCDCDSPAEFNCEHYVDGGWYELTLHELDLLRALVAWQVEPGSHSDVNHQRQEEDQLVDTLVKLIDVAVQNESQSSHAYGRAFTSTSTSTAERNEPHLVLLAYSATSRAIATAVARWKKQATATVTSHIGHETGTSSFRNTGLSTAEAQFLLRQAVTVVTIAGLCHTDAYPDGPAYLHVSMYDDPLAAPFQPPVDGAGQDAVVLRSWSPYLYDANSNNDDGCASISLANNAHNPEASAIQFLSLVMRKNGMNGQGFRQFYNEGSKPTPQIDMGPSYFGISYYINKVGELDLPYSEDILAAMIRATGGDRWLLTPLHLRDKGDEILPDCNNAESIITENFGYGVYEEIVDACGGQSETKKSGTTTS